MAKNNPQFGRWTKEKQLLNLKNDMLQHVITYLDENNSGR